MTIGNLEAVLSAIFGGHMRVNDMLLSVRARIEPSVNSRGWEFNWSLTDDSPVTLATTETAVAVRSSVLAPGSTRMGELAETITNGRCQPST
eukprot:5196490-Alexandrium_andersonii.AAC.1